MKFNVTMRHLWMLGLVLVSLFAVGFIAGTVSGCAEEEEKTPKTILGHGILMDTGFGMWEIPGGADDYGGTIVHLKLDKYINIDVPQWNGRIDIHLQIVCDPKERPSPRCSLRRDGSPNGSPSGFYSRVFTLDKLEEAHSD